VGSPLVSAQAYYASTAIALAASAGLLVAFAVLVFDGRGIPLLLVYCATGATVAGWRLWRSPPKVREKWIPAAVELPHDAPAVEPVARTFARRLADRLAVLPVALALIWLFSRVAPVEVAAGIVAGAMGWPVAAREAWSLSQWQRRQGRTLLREMTGGDSDRHRFFFAARDSGGVRAHAA
jgi:hypothetical protein